MSSERIRSELHGVVLVQMAGLSKDSVVLVPSCGAACVRGRFEAERIITRPLSVASPWVPSDVPGETLLIF